MKANILIIGGSAAGFVAASTAKMKHPDKEVVLVRKEENVMIPCGIPYVFGTVNTTEKNILPDAGLQKAGVVIQIGEVVNIDFSAYKCMLADGTEISYEKLIVSTGSLPLMPKWLKGGDLENVFTIPKNKVYLDEFHKKLEKIQDIVVIGAGFIGVEMADELKKAGKNVTLVEKLHHILGMAFDKELADEAEILLKERGVNLVTGNGIQEIVGEGKVAGIRLENGQEIIADAVVLSMGYAPNTALAKKCGLEINEKGFIKVDEYLRTNQPNVFATGDCAEKKDFFTRKTNMTMLASTACAESRVAGMNLYKLSTLKNFKGTIAVYSTAIGDTAFATAGLTENTAIKEGFEIVTGDFEGIDRHPGSLPDAHKLMVKLIVAKENETVLGGEIIGGKSTGELINVIGFAILNQMTVSALLTTQIGTHPLLTGSPAAYPLIKAAEAAYRNATVRK